MDGKYLEPDSNFHYKKQPRLNGEFGRLSELPEEIIIFVLSFLPLRECARTSALSSKWRYLWKYTHNLNINTHTLHLDSQTREEMSWLERRKKPWDPENCEYIKLVDSLLQSHKSPLKELIISFYVNKTAASKLNNWLEFAFSRGVESLELDLKGYLAERKGKVALKHLLRPTPTPPHIFSLNLKRLCLKSLKVGGEAIKSLLRNCPSLEELTICNAILTSRVEICGVALKRLVVFNCIAGWKFVRLISAPNLTWLKTYCRYGKPLFEKDVPKLLEAEFIILSKKFIGAKPSPCCISQLQTLHLTLSCPKVFSANGLPQMPNLKKLHLKFHGIVKRGLEPVTALIWAFPLLQECRLVFRRISGDRTSSMGVVTNVGRSEHRHLKVFEFGEFLRDVSDHIELVRYILYNCVALEKIIIGRLPLSPISDRVRDLKGEVEATRDYLNLQLQGKVAPHIHLLLL